MVEEVWRELSEDPLTALWLVGNALGFVLVLLILIGP
jgi:hypothetical protein